MPAISNERAHWLARHIVPLEPQLRAWLARAVPRGLQPDDVVQEAYAKLAVLPSLLEIQQPRAYLFQIARRLISEHIRRANVIPIESLAELSHEQVEHEVRSPERIVSAHQELERLCIAIDRLSSGCRTVFILRKIEDMPLKQVAEHLKVSERCVEKRMSRALKGIMKALQSPRMAAGAGLESRPPTHSALQMRKRRRRAP